MDKSKNLVLTTSKKWMTISRVTSRLHSIVYALVARTLIAECQLLN